MDTLLIVLLSVKVTRNFVLKNIIINYIIFFYNMNKYDHEQT